METRAKLLLMLDRYTDAENVYMRLLERNANCVDYMKQIESCKTRTFSNYFWFLKLLIVVFNDILVAAENAEAAKSIINRFYDQLIAKYPRNRAIKIRAFHFKEQDEFRVKFFEFLVEGLRAGLPSLFNCLCVFYENIEQVSSRKVHVI